MKTRNMKLIIGVAVTVSVLLIVIMIGINTGTKSTAKEASNTGTVQTDDGTLFSGISASVANSINHKIKEGQKNQQAQAKKLEQYRQENEKLKKKVKAAEEAGKQVDPEVTRKLADLESRVRSIDNQISMPNDTVTSDTVGDGNKEVEHKNTTKWITDEAVVPSDDEPVNSRGLNSNLFNNKNGDDPDKDKPKPAFTIPIGSIFTDVVVTTPLVGRTPRGDEHQVFQKYGFGFIVGKENYTSKNFRLPKAIEEITGTGHCVGDWLAKANYCEVDSTTFIFEDGTISTFKVKNKTIGNGIATLTDEYGNSQIKGELFTGLGLRAAMKGLSGGVGALGAGIQQAGLNVPTAGGAAFPFAAVSNVPLFAGGQALGATGSSVSKEFDDTTKNIFDYVASPNWDDETKSVIKFHMKVDQQIEIDYDPKGRKLDHHLFGDVQESSSSEIF